MIAEQIESKLIFNYHQHREQIGPVPLHSFNSPCWSTKSNEEYPIPLIVASECLGSENREMWLN